LDAPRGAEAPAGGRAMTVDTCGPDLPGLQCGGYKAHAAGVVAMSEAIDIAIIGGGPAGLAAALYGARARASTVVFEIGFPGGQIVKTEFVENYPGFPEGISGPELGEFMREQAERFGAEFRTFAPVEELRLHGDDFVLVTDEEEVLARSVVLATGAIPRKLGVPGEGEYTGRGVSWCATCDGALFRDKTLVVVGGGDSAAQEAEFLTKFAKMVYMVHRRDEFRATECLVEKCTINPKIGYKLSRVITEIVGEEGKVHAVRLASTKGEPDEVLPVDGVFIFVGIEPQNQLVVDLVELDAAGFVVVDLDCRTSVPGIYAAGDVNIGSLKQVVTAAAQGATAVFDALKYIDTKVCAI
jgi:thioredoxin reductase (NADPH)